MTAHSPRDIINPTAKGTSWRPGIHFLSLLCGPLKSHYFHFLGIPAWFDARGYRGERQEGLLCPPTPSLSPCGSHPGLRQGQAGTLRSCISGLSITPQLHTLSAKHSGSGTEQNIMGKSRFATHFFHCGEPQFSTEGGYR